MKPFFSHTLSIRGLNYHVREWGNSGAPKLFMLHGWADVSATFQFVVDALQHDWHVLAPDWRGFGQSARSDQGVSTDAYWFPDYLGDLDALLDILSPQGPATLIGHSMGGLIGALYAGIRPDRVAKLIMLDAITLPPPPPEQAPERYGRWLKQLQQAKAFRCHPSLAAFRARLCELNPRLTDVQADFLSTHLSENDPAGGVRFAAEAAHRNISPILYRQAEAESCWRQIQAQVLWILQADPSWQHNLGISDTLVERCKQCYTQLQIKTVGDCGHNLHHDQATQVASLIEAFLAAA